MSCSVNDLYARITKLCDDKGVSRYKMCKETGLQPSFLTDLKMCRQHGMSAKKAAKLAEYFNVSAEYLLYGKEKTATSGDGQQPNTYSISYEDKHFLEWFRSLPRENRKQS